MTKLLLAVLVAWLGWYLWVGPKKYRGGGVPPRPGGRAPGPDMHAIPPEMADARALLGVGDDADEKAIRAAHRRLVMAVHPDKGGSAELTRRINAARDTLLRRSN